MVAIGVTLLVVILVLFLIIVAIKKNKGNSAVQAVPLSSQKNSSITGNNPVASPSTSGEPQSIGTNPRQISGVVEKIAGDNLIIKQLASADIHYNLNKSEVSSVTKLEKNPNFDQTKAGEITKEIQSLSQVDPQNTNNSQLQKENEQKMQEIQKKIAETPELQIYLQKQANWSDIQTNSKIILEVNPSKGNEMVILPDDFPLGPPEAQK